MPHQSGSLETTSAASKCGVGSPSLANTSMVPYTNKYVSRSANTSSTGGRYYLALSQLQFSTAGESTPASRLENLRRRFKAEAVPEKAIELILASFARARLVKIRGKRNSTAQKLAQIFHLHTKTITLTSEDGLAEVPNTLGVVGESRFSWEL